MSCVVHLFQGWLVTSVNCGKRTQFETISKLLKLPFQCAWAGSARFTNVGTLCTINVGLRFLFLFCYFLLFNDAFLRASMQNTTLWTSVFFLLHSIVIDIGKWCRKMTSNRKLLFRMWSSNFVWPYPLWKVWSLLNQALLEPPHNSCFWITRNTFDRTNISDAPLTILLHITGKHILLF